MISSTWRPRSLPCTRTGTCFERVRFVLVTISTLAAAAGVQLSRAALSPSRAAAGIYVSAQFCIECCSARALQIGASIASTERVPVWTRVPVTSTSTQVFSSPASNSSSNSRGASRPAGSAGALLRVERLLPREERFFARLAWLSRDRHEHSTSLAFLGSGACTATSRTIRGSASIASATAICSLQLSLLPLSACTSGSSRSLSSATTTFASSPSCSSDFSAWSPMLGPASASGAAYALPASPADLDRGLLSYRRCVSGVANRRLRWEEAVYLVSMGRLGWFGRLEEDRALYRRWSATVLREWLSIGDYVLHQKLGVPFELVPVPRDLPLLAVPGAQPEFRKRSLGGETENGGNVRLVLLPNEFPYALEAGVRHEVLWCSSPVSVSLLEEWLQAHIFDREVIFFVNPLPLQSVAAVFHAHVLSRARSSCAAEPRVLDRDSDI